MCHLRDAAVLVVRERRGAVAMTRYTATAKNLAGLLRGERHNEVSRAIRKAIANAVMEERRACEQVCLDYEKRLPVKANPRAPHLHIGQARAALFCASAIRARGDV